MAQKDLIPKNSSRNRSWVTLSGEFWPLKIIGCELSIEDNLRIFFDILLSLPIEIVAIAKTTEE